MKCANCNQPSGKYLLCLKCEEQKTNYRQTKKKTLKEFQSEQANR